MTSAELEARMLQIQELYRELTKSFNADGIKVMGESIRYWKDYFQPLIPPDGVTPGVLKDLAIQLLQLYHEASFYCKVATTRAAYLKGTADTNYYTMYQEILVDYTTKGNKMPAANVLEHLASIKNEMYSSASKVAEVEARFWKDILEDLTERRKLLENASLNLSVELKATNAERSIESLANRSFGGR